ncbi:MAG: hypothetical protein JWO68_965 [Actinomycetia bacterium]|nr:hypothetical protein [Actinomycetes bacterium]
MDVYTATGTGELATPAQATCIAERFIDVIGLDTLQSSGVTPEQFGQGSGDAFAGSLDIDEPTARELFDQFGECDLDLAAASFEQFTSEGPPLDAEGRACVQQAITNDRLREAFVDTLLGRTGDNGPYEEASKCVSDRSAPPTTLPGR